MSVGVMFYQSRVLSLYEQYSVSVGLCRICVLLKQCSTLLLKYCSVVVVFCRIMQFVKVVFCHGWRRSQILILTFQAIVSTILLASILLVPVAWANSLPLRVSEKQLFSYEVLNIRLHDWQLAETIEGYHFWHNSTWQQITGWNTTAFTMFFLM